MHVLHPHRFCIIQNVMFSHSAQILITIYFNWSALSDNVVNVPLQKFMNSLMNLR